MSSRGILWSLTRGEVIHSNGRALAIDGIKNVNEFLENIENEKLDQIDFLELRACDERAEEYQAREDDKERKLTDGFLDINEHGFLGDISPRPMSKLDEDFTAALKKMERQRRIMCFLPGFDCAGCGAPDCQTLSEDIVQGNAQISHCIFMQHQMIKQNVLSQNQAVRITENIWGEGRLEKNCNKLGAEDENN